MFAGSKVKQLVCCRPTASAAAVLGLFALAARAELPSGPSPQLTPEALISTQLEALRTDPARPDHGGIRIAYAFASDSNRKAVGPIDEFIQVLTSNRYAPLLGFEKAFRSVVTVRGDKAWQMVRVIAADGEPAGFRWELVRDDARSCEGCWFTNSVERLKEKETRYLEFQ